MEKKKIIWKSSINLEDWQDFLEEEGLLEEPEHIQYEAASDMNQAYLGDERINLNLETKQPIVAIASWNGWGGNGGINVSLIGSNVSKILESPYYGIQDEEWYCDRYDVRWTGVHHDGRNSALYRELKDAEKYGAFIEALKKADDVSQSFRPAITRYTRSLRPHIAEVYGW